MIEGLQLTIPRRMILVRIVLTFSMIVSVVLSFNLWAGERSFPMAPVIALYQNYLLIDYLIVSLILLLCVASLFMQWHRLLILFVIALSALLVMNDLNRLQPWFYVYSCMLFVFVCYNGRVDDSNKFTAYFILLQIMLASVYFFCGLSQLNDSFVESEFTAIVDPLRSMVSERQFLFFKRLGVFVPYALMFVGLGLIISPVRYLAITLAICIHVLLLVLLFPSQNYHNYTLWLSNFSFLLMLVLLFSGKTKQRYFSPAILMQMPAFYGVILLFVILPFTNRSGLWPDYLSSNFKSGCNKKITVSIKPQVYQNLPLYERAFCAKQNDIILMDYQRWCKEELSVECYPARPIFNSIYQHISRFERPDVKDSELALTTR